MIVKERNKPVHLEGVEALLRRLPTSHPKYSLIKEEAAKRTAGYKGELSLDYYFSLTEKKEAAVFHDLRLSLESQFFQIDSLYLTKEFALLIEVKNWAGSLYFDSQFSQLIRTSDGQETAFPDPLTQLSRQEYQLKQWMAGNQISILPVHSFIVMTNPQSILRTSPENKTLGHKVIRLEKLLSKIRQFEDTHKRQLWNDKEWKKVIRLLKKQHQDPEINAMKKFGISKEELKKGVICLKCQINLTSWYGRWHCPKCDQTSNVPLIQALLDYSSLISTGITNKSAREFLQIESPYTVKRIFQNLNLPHTGDNKGRTYHLEKNLLRERLNRLT
ncbi:NERD domain-containing protein [Metabacillus sp. GX 13764]|uniref:nuclease-related domain-containing protein n=1 Tax=Metabacillus kandeliae TaxID=2900151 RepID=UPI001E347272|nr:nuclease-related domain-containing protein [Metabacillus kandeliae]MCD7035801.1 NERD domain-containing protein [Metabacillus kandeliae]